MQTAFEAEGCESRTYVEAREAIHAELLHVRFTPKMVERLADTLRAKVAEIRIQESAIMAICVNLAGMPGNHFIDAFPRNVTNLDWVLEEIGRASCRERVCQNV